jgi:hypothetical protein
VHQTRSIRFIGREDLGDWRLKVYGIGTHAPDARPEFVAATLEAARTVLPKGGGVGFVIAHDARTAGLGLVYWWANENEIHGRFFASPLDDPAALVPNDGAGVGCVWELEVLTSSAVPGWRTSSRTTTSTRTSRSERRTRTSEARTATACSQRALGRRAHD